jgi:hypothetical protein
MSESVCKCCNARWEEDMLDDLGACSATCRVRLIVREEIADWQDYMLHRHLFRDREDGLE